MPDLTTLGKIIGGGMPIGAYGGRADIMRHMAPLGNVYQAGTLSGNPLATVCGIATLQLLHNSDYYQKLEVSADALVNGLREEAQNVNIPIQVNQGGIDVHRLLQ